jgi:hypothetical protein
MALMLLWSGAAIAQSSVPTAPSMAPPSAPPGAATPAPPGATTAAPEGISRDDYIAKARDAAAKRAATRFDAMDANHDGVLTKDETAAYRAAHSRKKTDEPE